MNFVHTFTYFYEWVIKKNVDKINITIKQGSHTYNTTVGALLTGNPKHFAGCKIQGFFLIFSSISQDFLINIFFYLVNSSSFTDFKAKLLVILLGISFPFIFTIILEIVGAIGLNDKFCYVKKFRFEINENEVEYHYYTSFQVVVIIVYLVRVLNFIASVYFLVKIWSYVKQENKPKFYIFKSVFIPIIQLFTIGIGVIYRFINLVSPKASENLSAPYLILNTVDGVLFPIGFILQNSIFSQINKLINEKEEDNPDDKDKGIEFVDKKEEDDDDNKEETEFKTPN